MKTLNLTSTKLSNIINNNEFIGNGSRGLVVKLDDNYLLKFDYKKFINEFDTDNNKFNLHKLGDITNRIENIKQVNQIIYKDIETTKIKMIKLAMGKQEKLKYTTLTQGLVYVNDLCIGYILKYHKNMLNLYQYQKENNICPTETEIILDKIKISMKEMIKNYIYLSDFTTHNILYNPETKQIEIIDFEDSLTCYTRRSALDEKTMLEEFDRICQSFSKNKDNEKIFSL